MPKPIQHIFWSIKFVEINAPQHFGPFYSKPIKETKRIKSGNEMIASGSLMIRVVVHSPERTPKKGYESQGGEGEHGEAPHWLYS